MIGSTLSHHRILKKLGEGGMGEVYKAHDTKLDRLVALKVLSSRALSNQVEKERFLREAQIAAALSHPNICTIYEVEEVDGSQFIVMEYVDGKTFRQLEPWNLPLETVLPYLTQIAEGLHAAHSKGIVHRDIKPENIIISQDGVVKIMDFGIAEMKGRSRITQLGMTVGTVAYMSPEQARGEEVDERTDIWSFGVVLYEALTGKSPFQSDYEQAILYLILHENPPSIRTVKPEVPSRLERLVEKCLKKERSERFGNAKELVEELRTIQKEMEAGVETKEPVAQMVEQRRFEAERRPVTILFASILTGENGDEMDPEVLSTTLNECSKGLISIIQRYEGMTDRIVGEKLMAIFGTPIAHENDPERAVRCAQEMMSFVKRLNSLGITQTPEELQLKIGIHTGLVIAGNVEGGKDTGYSVVGDTINMAAAVVDLAPPGEVYLSSEAYKLVAHLVEIEQKLSLPVRGKKGEVTVYPFRSVKAGVEPGRRAIGAGEFVGREKEIRLFEKAIQDVLAKKSARVFIQGEAGVGKTRLKNELVARAQKKGISICEGVCSSFEINTPYYLWNTFLKSLLRIGMETPESEIRARLHETMRILSLESEEPYLATLLSLRYEEILLEVDEERKRRIFEATKKLLKVYAERRPSLFVFEDLHWIDRFSQDLLDFVLSDSGVGPALIVCQFRPEYARAAQISAKGEKLDLDRLSGEDAKKLIVARFGAENIPEKLTELIEQRTEGNPFFIEEIIKTLLEKELVRVKKGSVEIVSENIEAGVPETVQGVILSRIDQLEERLREVVLDASVIGREFSRPVLEQVVQKKADIPGALQKLEALEFILEKEEARELEYLFKHYLIQEVAYNTILAKRRRKLHGMIAEAIEKLYADRLKEFYELLAFHYEKAENWGKAAEYLSRAGRKVGEVFSKEESNAFADRKEIAIQKLFESSSEKRIGWIVLGVITGVVLLPLAAALLSMPFFIAYMVWLVLNYTPITFSLFGSEFLGGIGFFFSFVVLLLFYPWLGLLFAFFGIVPAFKGRPQLFDITDDGVRVLFSRGKTLVIPFSDIQSIWFFDPRAKKARPWKQKILDPFYRIPDFSKFTIGLWFREVVTNVLPPYSFGFGSRKGEVLIVRPKGVNRRRLLMPWLNTPTKARLMSISPSDPREFFEQLQVGMTKWRSKQT